MLEISGKWFLNNDHEDPNLEKEVVRLVIRDSVLKQYKVNPFSIYKDVFYKAIKDAKEIYGPIVSQIAPTDTAIYKSVLTQLKGKKMKQPRTRNELHVIEEQRKTVDGFDFLLFDDRSEERIIAFAHPKFLELMCKSEVLVMDGTFYVCPKLFAQLYTIHANLGSDFIAPVIYAFLPDRTESTYVRFLRLIVHNLMTKFGLTLMPNRILIDFEKAMANAIKKVFVSTHLDGCNWHFGEAIIRKVKENLAVPYKIDNMFKSFVLSFICLQHLPLNKVEEV